MLDIRSIATDTSYEYICYYIHGLVMLIMAEWNEACSRNSDICYLVYGLVNAYGVMSPLLAATIPVQHRLLGITMQLHTLWGMKARDMAFSLHMHYDFGLWYICFGFKILERY